MPRRRLDRLPIYEQTCAATLIDPDEEVRLVGRHHHSTEPIEPPDELPPDEHAACATEADHIGDETAYDGSDDLADAEDGMPR